MFIETKLDSTSLPYGQFTVYVVRATSAYRCFDTGSKSIIAAGTARGEARGEDGALAMEQAGNSSLLALARAAAPKLV